jgi:hypothetical protein
MHNELPANVNAVTDEVNRTAARARLAPRVDAAGSSQLVPEAAGVVAETARDGTRRHASGSCEQVHRRQVDDDS